jgi:hypothetical protein
MLFCAAGAWSDSPLIFSRMRWYFIGAHYCIGA